MQLLVTRDLKTRSLKLGLELSVHELAALQRAELLTYDLYSGHSVADLQMGWAGICKTVGEMVEIEHGVRAKLDTLNRYISDNAPAPLSEKTAPSDQEVPDHTHPHEVRSVNLIMFTLIGLALMVIVYITRAELLFQSLNKIVHAW